MNAQETLNTVMRHAYKQNCKSGVQGACLYRGPNNTRCFIGALIPDDVYRQEMEKHSVSSLSDFNPVVDQHLTIDGWPPEITYPFLRRLQSIHDRTPVGKWPKYFAMFANMFKLKIEVTQ